MGGDDHVGPRGSHKTSPGYSDLKTPVPQGEACDTEEGPRPPVPVAKRSPSEHPFRVAANRTPLVEIEVVHEHGPAPNMERPWRTVEVWTRNRIYALDSTLSCYEVRDRGNREPVQDHPFLGLRLVGGQHREGEAIELSYPFPRPGTEAVFEQRDRPGKGGGFSRTSAVARVILRLHIVTVAPRSVVPTWEEISGSFPAPDTSENPE